jgi:serine/threonine-protein kinase
MDKANRERKRPEFVFLRSLTLPARQDVDTMSERPSFDETQDHPVAGASILPSLAAKVPEVPHIHLRDALTEGATPVNLPNSPELPELKSTPGAVPRLQILGEIARGGMGAILKARDVDLGRDLVVKVLLEAHQGKPEMMQRFIEEAQISGQLQHPGVAPIHELGIFPDGRPYFTMKLVKGQTLAAHLAERKKSPQEQSQFLAHFAQVCQTLAYAHAHGVIHRDLKPSNIMVGAYGEVQVMDWGLAKVLKEGGIADEVKSRERTRAENLSVIRTGRSGDSDAPGSGSQTQAGTLLGTPAYMAPEQARGDVELVDERADVFGLGAILCEILTGKPPFTGKTAEAQRKAQKALLDDAYQRLNDCGADAELIELAKHCLAAEPWDRPRHAGEVAARVTTYQNAVAERLRQSELARAAEEARAVEARATAAQQRRAQRMTLMLAATVLLTVLLGGGGWLWLRYQQEEKRRDNDRLVSDAYNEAALLHKQAREAPEREARELATRVREQLRRAEALVESGPTDPNIVEQVNVLRRELNADDQDRTLVAALEAARLAQADNDSEGKTFASKQSALPLFREAFRAYGMPVGEGEIEAAAARLRQRPEAVREAVAAALDDWVGAAEDLRAKIDEPALPWLRALLEAAEPEGWAKQVREAAAEPNFYHRRARLANLAATVETKRLPPQALTRLADRILSLGDRDTALTLLLWAQRQHPQDFWINEYLGQYLLRHRPNVPADALAYLRTAVALRPGSAGARLNLSIALRIHGQQQEAVALLRQLVADNPRFTPAYLYLGTTLEEQGNRSEAIATYQKALELAAKDQPDATHQFTFNSLVRMMEKQGRLDEVVALGREEIQRHPKEAWPYQSLCNILEQQGKKAEAIALWQKAAEQNPSAVWPYTLLGLYFSRQNQLDEAIAAFRQACQRDPKSADSYSNLSRLLRQQGKADEALAVWREAIQRHPKESWPYIAFSYFLTQQGKPDQALALMREAAQRNPKADWPHLHMGNALEAQGKLDAALAEYKKALELDPENAMGPFHICSILKKQGKANEILAVWREAMRRHPGNSYFYSQFLQTLREQGKQDEIAAAWREIVERYPDDAGSHYELGWALKEQGNLDAAMAEYKKAIELNPHHTVAHDNLGYALFLQGKYDEAIAECRTAIRLSPWHANSHNSLALALWEQGHSAQAVAAYRKAIELDPRYTAAHDNLGNALYALDRLEEAAAEYRRASELGNGDATRKWRRCQRLLALGERLPATLQSAKPPQDAVLRIDLADLCYRRKHYARSTQLFADAFAADGKLVEDIHATYRYDAACSAALAGCGRGEDAKKLDARELTRLRRQALDWLRDDLISYGKLVDGGKPAERALVQHRLQYWHIDRDLVGIRDAKELTKLPSDDRQAWEKLWADVTALLEKTREKK